MEAIRLESGSKETVSQVYLGEREHYHVGEGIELIWVTDRSRGCLSDISKS